MFPLLSKGSINKMHWKISFHCGSLYVWRAIVVNLCSLCRLFPSWKLVLISVNMLLWQTPVPWKHSIRSSYMYLNEVFLDTCTCMYHKQSMTAVTTAHVSARLRSFLYHVLLARALHRFIDECDQRVRFSHLWSRTKF